MKTQEILSHLRKRIVSGEFPPGSKLPNRPELLMEYSVSAGAFQKCINQLIKWGFLESRGMKGVCITANPPYLSRFALILPVYKSGGLEDTLFQAVLLELPAFQERHPGISFEFYHVGHPENPDQKELERLQNDASLGLLAGGVFFSFVPAREVQTKLSDFPIIIISKSPEDTFHNYPLISFDLVELFRMCRNSLLKQKCKRIAILAHSMLSLERITKISEIISDGKAFTPPEWILGLFHETGRPILKRNLIRLLFSGPSSKRPDSLIVLNENLLPFVHDALQELSLLPGEDVMIASHCNYPFPKKPLPRVEYFIFDAREMLEKCFEIFSAYSSASSQTLLIPYPLENIK